MLARMISRGLAPATARGVMTGVARQSWNLILGFGLSIPVFFVTPYAWIMWIVVPLLLTQVRRVHRRARGHPKVT